VFVASRAQGYAVFGCARAAGIQIARYQPIVRRTILSAAVSSGTIRPIWCNHAFGKRSRGRHEFVRRPGTICPTSSPPKAISCPFAPIRLDLDAIWYLGPLQHLYALPGELLIKLPW